MAHGRYKQFGSVSIFEKNNSSETGCGSTTNFTKVSLKSRGICVASGGFLFMPHVYRVNILK